jgi:hypothetical protein
VTDPPTIAWDRGRLCLGGTVTAAGASAWRSAVEAAARAGDGPDLELGELDLDEGVAVAEAVNAVRALAGLWGPLRLHEAPQMLAHTLYKVGALGPHLVLVDPRSDEGTMAP